MACLCSTIGRAVSRRSSSHENARNALAFAGRRSSPARHSAHTQNPARPIRSIPIDRLFSDEEDNALSGQPVAGPSHHREDADRLRATNLFRRTRVAQLEREREDRARHHRRAIRSGSQRGTLTANEANLRANENRAIDAIHRELLLSRVEAPLRNASASRGRDILRHGIRDAEDGVRRCIDCNWEIEDGVCQHW